MTLKKSLITSTLSASLIWSPLLAQAQTEAKNISTSDLLAQIEQRRTLSEEIVRLESSITDQQERLLALNLVLKTAEEKKYAQNVSLKDVKPQSSLTLGLLFTELAVFVAGGAVWQGMEKYNAHQVAAYQALKSRALEVATQASIILTSPNRLVGGGSQFLDIVVDKSLIPQAMKDINALVAQYKPAELKAAAVFIYNNNYLSREFMYVSEAVASGKGWQTQNELSKAAAHYRKLMGIGRAGNAFMGLALIAAIPTGAIYFFNKSYALNTRISEATGMTAQQAIDELNNFARTGQQGLLTEKIDEYALQAIQLSTNIMIESSRLETFKSGKH